MTSPFHIVNNGTCANVGDTIAVTAPMNNSHRVIIDLSQDDSDNNEDAYMDVVEILDSPIPPARSMHHLNGVELFTQQFHNHSIHHPPLSVTQNASAITYPMTAYAFGAQQAPPRSTTATVKTKSGSNGHQSHLRERNSENQNSFRLNASTTVSVSDSIQLPNTEGRDGSLFNQLFHQQISTPIHHYSHRQTNHVHSNNNSTTRATTETTTRTNHAASRNDFSRGSSHSPNTNSHHHHGRRRNNRRRGYVGTSAARRGNHASPPRQTFAIIHHLAQDQLLRRHDSNINNYHNHHHRHHHDDGRLLNIDNLSYEELLSIFGNGSENCGAPVTDISLLPVVTVTKDDIFKSETTADGCSYHEQTDMNSNKYCCSICLENYEIGDQKKILPCFHNFHETCADQWLLRNGSCPICKHRLNQSLVDT